MNQKDENEHILKFLLVGDSGSGKTSLLLRYSEDKFLDHQLAVRKKFIYKRYIIFIFS